MNNFPSRSILRAFLMVLLLGSACSPKLVPDVPESPTPFVPFGDAPLIDGTLAPTEWDAAHIETFADGNQLLLMRDASYLYLAIRSATEEMIAANIYTAEDGQIIIRHASAALGTGIYQQNGSTWLKTQDFHWQCRATNNSATAQAEREHFLQGEGWLAANSRMGTPNELEYQIKITSETLSLAISFMRSSTPDERITFPVELADDTIQPTPGGLPETRNFSPETWLLINLDQDE